MKHPTKRQVKNQPHPVKSYLKGFYGQKGHKTAKELADKWIKKNGE